MTVMSTSSPDMQGPGRDTASTSGAEPKVWTAPPGPRGLLCDPPLEQWEAVAAANRAVLNGMDFDVAGVPAGELRRAARRRVLGMAGIEPPAAEDQLVIVTGHQPQFYHPGVWAKAFAVTAVTERSGAAGLNVAVDHDAGELAAEVPWRHPSEPGRLVWTKEFLVPPVGGRPLETLPPPGAETTESFLQKLAAHVETLGWRAGSERVRIFGDVLRSAAADASSAAEVGLLARQRYEAAFGQQLIPDVPVSRISRTPEFLRFFVHWAYHADVMRRHYNDALADYRRRRRVRSQANPFPDLLERPDQGVELPFWALTAAGVRRKLYAREADDGMVLSHLEGEVARLPAEEGEGAVAALLEAGVQVRPRAVPLTVFHRLFVADLFVHGTGGGAYDEVTSAFIEAAFGVPAPTYAVVSATLSLPLGERPVQPGAVRALRRQLRDLRFNPQRFAWELGIPDQQLAALLRRKEELIDAIQQAERGGSAGPSPKRVLTREIEQVNEALYRALGPVEQSLRAQLAELEVRAAAGAVATRRTYPFFLYDPAELWDLLGVSRSSA